MKTLYLDIFSGISGDMFIGALLDLGVDARRLERELKKLGLQGYHLRVARGHRATIEGVKFDVHLGHEHTQKHDLAGSSPHFHPHSSAEHGHPHSVLGAHGGPLVKTSAGQVELSVFETNIPPRFRLYFSNVNGKPIAP